MRLSTEYIILGILMSGSKHGYEIMQILDDELGSTWSVGSSQLYLLLKRLEGMHYVGSSMEVQESRPSKRVFEITPAGRDAFLGWLNSTTDQVRKLRTEFMAKIFFFHRLSLKGGEELIARQTLILRQVESKIRRRQDAEKNLFEKLSLDLKAKTVEIWIQWLEEKARPFLARPEGNGI